MASFEIDFLPVGEGERSGDAIALRYGNEGRFSIHVVDGGDEAAGEKLVRHINDYYGGPPLIDHVVLTHADDDHSSGLREIVDSFNIGALWMNRPWLYAAEIIHMFRDSRFTVQGLERRLKQDYPILAEIEERAARKSIPIFEAFQGAQAGDFLVLSPSRQRYLELIPQFSRTPQPKQASHVARRVGILAQAMRAAADWVAEGWGRETLEEDVETSASNESSVVQCAVLDGQTVLLTGDAGVQSLHEAADFAAARGLELPGVRFIQVAHHGSRHNVSPSALNRWLGEPLQRGETRQSTAFASVAADDDERPRRKVTNAFIRRGASVHVTKGASKSHHHNMPGRPGWIRSVPLEFSDQVEA